ncbi:MAG: recombinase family protein [Myxococcales bacterium]|nr:recombinase family protein [Myxococcales bacterium]
MSTVRFGLYARTAAGGDTAADAQITALRAAVARRGGATVLVECDVNASGAGRPGPGLTALLDTAATGQVDAIVVAGLDRLGRSSRTLGEILGALRRAGVSVLVPEEER